jgi:hypothetical protein
MLDVKTGNVVRNPMVVVTNGRITAVGVDASIPAGATVIDVGDAMREDLEAGIATVRDLGTRGSTVTLRCATRSTADGLLGRGSLRRRGRSPRRAGSSAGSPQKRNH